MQLECTWCFNFSLRFRILYALPTRRKCLTFASFLPPMLGLQTESEQGALVTLLDTAQYPVNAEHANKSERASSVYCISICIMSTSCCKLAAYLYKCTETSESITRLRRVRAVLWIQAFPQLSLFSSHSNTFLFLRKCVQSLDIALPARNLNYSFII